MDPLQVEPVGIIALVSPSKTVILRVAWISRMSNV